MQQLTIQLFLDQQWQDVALLDITSTSAHAPVFSYTREHVLKYFGQIDCCAVASTEVVDFFPKQSSLWPSFLYDIAPQGYGKRRLLQDWPNRSGFPDPWYLLSIGAANPVGNMRIKEAALHFQHVFSDTQAQFAQGFSKTDVFEQSPEFLEYVVACHYGVAGSSGLQGECPKYLLVEDYQGRFHIDGMIDDAQVAQHFIFKLPKTRNGVRDLQILQTEPAYLEVARDMGCKVSGSLVLHQDALLIPRFDRLVSTQGVERVAQESLLTLMNKPGYGISFYHQEAIFAMTKYCTHAHVDIAEYVWRDMLNLALGNRDNHGRNTAFHRHSNNITIAPLFDFAPMYLDQDAITRSATWQHFEKSGHIEFVGVMDWLLNNIEPIKAQATDFVAFFQERLPLFQCLTSILEKHQVDERIIANCQNSIDDMTQQAELVLRKFNEIGKSL